MKTLPGTYTSWGNVKAPILSARVLTPDEKKLDGLPGDYLPYGLGRSYGDSCLLTKGDLLSSKELSRFHFFDDEKGILRVEAGMTLGEILSVISPRGWFLPVLPGTQFVTVGGAIANDIHSKNHHRKGTFGCHLLRFALLRSDRGCLECSIEENSELFRATIGGLGLTGMILWAEIRLMRIPSPDIDVEEIPFGSVSEFARLAQESNETHEYTVAWIDCLGTGANLGRGIFIRGNHSEERSPEKTKSLQKPANGRGCLSIPFFAPEALLNPLTMGLFNAAYYHKSFGRIRRKRAAYQGFFFPLDAILHWNRLYGRRGFFQYQLLIPGEDYLEGIENILQMVASSGQGTFLSVLKTFGTIASPGMLSFPRAGATLTLDFPNKGERVLRLMDRLDDYVRELKGSVYPAKDARMSKEAFLSYFPGVSDFHNHCDPSCSSDFWNRVYEKE